MTLPFEIIEKIASYSTLKNNTLIRSSCKDLYKRLPKTITTKIISIVHNYINDLSSDEYYDSHITCCDKKKTLANC